MKILCTADLHIAPYNTHTKFVNGIPQRLLNYKVLTDKLCEIVLENNVDVVVLAGDTVDSPINKPMVMPIVAYLFDELSKVAQIVTVGGQHELDRRDDSDIEYNNYTKHLMPKNNRIFFGHDQVIEVDGVSFYLRGWSKDKDKGFKDADIFIGHDLVGGAITEDGFMFKSGYSPDDLSERYKLSVIGDIHHAQIFNDNVIIPGTPIQHNFRDSYNTGVYLVDYDKGVKSITFIPIDMPEFPKFKYVDSMDVVVAPNVIKRVKKKATKQPATKGSIEIGTDNQSIDIKDKAVSILSQYKDDFDADGFERARGYITRFIDNANSGIQKSISPVVKFKRISAEGFMSIKNIDLSFDFGGNEHQHLIVGSTGCGKSTLLELIGWMLYDKVSKGNQRSKDNVISDTFKGGVYGEFEISVAGTDYKIFKSKSHKDHGTIWYVDGHIDKSARVAEVADFIRNLIGVSSEEYFDLVYYSQERFSFFNNLSPTRQMDILRTLGDLGIIDNIQKQLDEEFKIASEAQIKANGALEANLRYMGLSDGVKEFEGVKSEILNEYPDIDLSKGLNTQFTEIVNKKHRISLVSLSDYSDTVQRLERKVANFNKEYHALKSGAKTVADRCYTCGQSLPEEKVKATQANLITEAIDAYAKYEEAKTSLDRVIEARDLVTHLSDLKSRFDLCKSAVKTIDILEQDMLSLKSTLAEAENKLSVLKNLKSKIFSNKGIYAYLLDSVGKDLKRDIKSFVDTSIVDVDITTVNINKTGSINPGLTLTACYDGGSFRDYSLLSGGQKRLIDLAVMVAINNKLREVKGDLLGVMFLDEVFVYFDAQYMEVAKGILDASTANSIFVITHEEELKSEFKSVITVDYSKKEGTTYKVI